MKNTDKLECTITPEVDTTNLPDGWTVEYRGRGWEANDKCYYVMCHIYEDGPYVINSSDYSSTESLCGISNYHYWELIPPAKASASPTKAQQRKSTPIYSGVMQYFPNALRAVAQCSKICNDQHNPGEPLHWAKEKSSDHHDSLVRHLLESGELDDDGVLHSTKVAWRALALLEVELTKEVSNG